MSRVLEFGWMKRYVRVMTLKYKEAQAQLKYALSNQKTISISKLKKILQSMNISLKRRNDTEEVRYLKGEIRKLKRAQHR